MDFMKPKLPDTPDTRAAFSVFMKVVPLINQDRHIFDPDQADSPVTYGGILANSYGPDAHHLAAAALLDWTACWVELDENDLAPFSSQTMSVFSTLQTDRQQGEGCSTRDMLARGLQNAPVVAKAVNQAFYLSCMRATLEHLRLDPKRATDYANDTDGFKAVAASCRGINAAIEVEMDALFREADNIIKQSPAPTGAKPQTPMPS